MVSLRMSLAALFLLWCTGCTQPPTATPEPGDPTTVVAFEAHWAALRRGDWRGAYGRVHPDLRAKMTLGKFTQFHSRRRKSDGYPQAVKIVSSETSGQDVMVSFDVLSAVPGVDAPAVVPPRRRVCLRKSGDSWNLMTHDILAVER